jgi:hypothetical protein
LIFNIFIGKSRLEESHSPKNMKNILPNKKSIKMIWQKLKTEFMTYIKTNGTTDPISYSSLYEILLALGFLTGSNHMKTIKNKEYVVEDQITKKILEVIKVPKSVTKEVYNSSESVTTIDVFRTLLYYLSVPSLNKDVKLYL